MAAIGEQGHADILTYSSPDPVVTKPKQSGNHVQVATSASRPVIRCRQEVQQHVPPSSRAAQAAQRIIGI